MNGEGVKVSLFAFNIIFYIGELKDATPKRLLELIRQLGKYAGYKINTQNSTTFVCTINSIFEKELINSLSFTIAAKKTLKIVEKT